MSADIPHGEPATVKECRQAIKLNEWELLRLIGELAERRRLASEHRRRYEKTRSACARIWRKCRDRVMEIELLNELIRSSSDGRTVKTGHQLTIVPAGVGILRQLEEILDEADVSSEAGRRELLHRLSNLQEFAKAFFDYAGVKLVYELGELLTDVRQEPKSLPTLLERAARLHRQAAEWFDRGD